MLVDLEVEEDENDKDNGATWDSPSQRDYSKEWQQAIDKNRESKGVRLPSVRFQKNNFFETPGGVSFTVLFGRVAGEFHEPHILIFY